eukprot:2194346-Rhodomonas_salina.1
MTPGQDPNKHNTEKDEENAEIDQNSTNSALLTFPVGYLGSIPTDTLHANLDKLGIDIKYFDFILTFITTATMASFSKMANGQDQT